MSFDVAWTVLAFFVGVLVIMYGPFALASYVVIRLMRRYKIGRGHIEPSPKPLNL